LAGPRSLSECWGFVSVVAFWSGLPPVLASGAGVLGWAQRDTRRGKIAIVLSALAIAADIGVYIGDRLSSG